MKKLIDNDFQDRTVALMDAGTTKYRAAIIMGVSRTTIRRALAAFAARIGAAMAEAGAAHCVYAPDVAPEPEASPLLLLPFLPAMAVAA